MPLGGGLTIGALAVGAGLKGYNLIKANKDQKKAQKSLDELSKQPIAEYSASPEMRGYYSKVLGNVNTPMGMTAAEKQAAMGNVNKSINTALYNVKGQTGGNLSKYLSGAFTPQIATASNNIALEDARMRMANYNANLGRLGGAASAFQNLRDRNTQGLIQRRMMQENALGQSVLQNKAFKTQSLEGLGSDLLGAGLTMGMGGLGGAKKANPFAVDPNAPINGYNYNQAVV